MEGCLFYELPTSFVTAYSEPATYRAVFVSYMAIPPDIYVFP